MTHPMSEPWLDWKPIASAPKDGTTVLLYSEDIEPNIFQGLWQAWTGSWEGGGEWVDIWNNDPIETNSGMIFPKLWASIPVPSPAQTIGDRQTS